MMPGVSVPEGRTGGAAGEDGLRLALEAARTGTWEWDFATGVVRWDASVPPVFGLEPVPRETDLAGYLARVHPADRSLVEGRIAAAIDGGAAECLLEHRTVWPDGSVHWLEGRGRVERGPDRRATGMRGIVTDVTARRRVDRLLRTLAQRTARATGAAFFATLVEQLAGALDAEVVFVGEHEPGPPERVRARALWTDGAHREGEPLVYALAGTPCEDVVGREACVHPCGVRRRFPDDAMLVDMGAEAYVGVPLFGGRGEPLGLIAALWRRELRDPELYRTAVAIMADRAAAELERHRAAGELAESAERYRLLFEAVRDAMLVIDPERGRIVDANEQAARLYGRPRAELVGLPVAEVSADAGKTGREVARVAARGEEAPRLRRNVHRRSDGSTFPAEIGASAVEVRGRTFVCALVRDVTARHEAERAREELTGFLEQTQSAARVGGWSFELDTQAVTWTDETYRILGVEPERFTPELESAIAFSAPEHQPMLRAALDEAAASGRRFDFELEAVTGRGQRRWLRAVGQGERRDGRVVRVVGAIQDIHERKQLEGQLLQAQKLEGIGRLAGGLAHDFNNILTAVMGYTQLARLQLPPDGSELAGHLDEILAAAGRGAALTSRLLGYARRQVSRPTVIDLDALLDRTGELLRRLISAEVTLEREPAEAETWPVRVDGGQLEQVLMNLVVNASDAMPRGGRVTLRTRNVRVEADGARAGLDLAPGDYALLEVADTGEGMTAEVADRAVEPFFTTKPVGVGTGLGLATCYGIVKQHGGHLELDSAPGAGTTVIVYLPRAAGDAEEASDAPTPSGGVGRETILVVEDDATVRALARAALEPRGFRILAAADGAAALELAERHDGPVDLLLTDVVMPRLGGVDLARRLQETRPGLRVLFASGYLEQEILPEGAAFLGKPFTPDEIASRVREELDRP